MRTVKARVPIRDNEAHHIEIEGDLDDVHAFVERYRHGDGHVRRTNRKSAVIQVRSQASGIVTSKSVPKTSEVVDIIKGIGFPYAHSTEELQVKVFGRRLDYRGTKEEKNSAKLFGTKLRMAHRFMESEGVTWSEELTAPLSKGGTKRWMAVKKGSSTGA